MVDPWREILCGCMEKNAADLFQWSWKGLQEMSLSEKQATEYVEYVPISVKKQQHKNLPKTKNNPACMHMSRHTQLLPVVSYIQRKEWDWRRGVKGLFPFNVLLDGLKFLQ